MQVVRQAKQKRFGFLALGIALLLGIAIGFGIGFAGDDGTAGTATSTPRAAVTGTADAPVGGSGAPTDETTDPEPDRTKAAYNPKPNDFKIGIKILEKQCHGSAGCIIAYQVVLSYVGSERLPAEGVTEVTYLVTGRTDSITNTLAVKSKGTVTFNDEFVDAPSSSGELTAKVTKVTYDVNG